MMKCRFPIWLPCMAVSLASCTQYAYFQSPFQSNTASYKTLPTLRDSTKRAVYANGACTLGGANDRLKDGVAGFIGSVYQAHTFKHFQVFYGFTGMAGSYNMKPYGSQAGFSTSRNNYSLNDSLINTMSGPKFYGGWGFTGGFNYLIPFPKSEWRVIGVEGNWQQEFGDYYRFRSKLPDTAANLTSHSRNYFTLAIGTDIVSYTSYGSVGYKMCYVSSVRTLQGYNKNRDPYHILPGYLSQTLHFTFNKVTAYGQFNLGTYAVNFLFGVNYRLNGR